MKLTEGRSWTLAETGLRPTTINRLVTLHRMQWASRTAEVRSTWAMLARAAKVPAIASCAVVVVPLHKDGRSPQDPAAAAPHAKAAVDGLVDAGVLPDDSGTYVLSVEFLPPRICGVDGLEITIIERGAA